MKKPTVLITGAAGFIGSALAWRLNQKGRADLLLVDHLGESPKWRNLVPLRYADYRDRTELEAWLKAGTLPDSLEAVIHLGACSATTEKDSGYLMRNNFGMTRDLARFCLDRNRPIPFVYASSAATYGDGALGYSDSYEPLDALRPLNGYGYSKHAFDVWAKEQGLLESMVGLKYFNVYGPNEYHKGDMRSMVVKAFEQIQADGKVKLFKSHHPDYKDGEQLRDFIHVLDAVDITLHLWNRLSQGGKGGLFNVGTGEARSWKDMMLALFAAMGRPPHIEFVPMPDALQGKYQYFTQADTRKLKATGYAQPIMSLEQGIAAYAAYLSRGLRVFGD
jgi:ADP-L-glycero-D-manno-heptose 6-epimerase